MRRWQLDAAFVVALLLLIFFAVAPYFGLEGTPDPIVVSGFGALIGFFFTRRDRISKDGKGDE